ncbi:uncharacterized protein [Musca autumnalis]|uniref:uncharacterized protein n=1 Tax=Musca autumnalis TaxID=221902 RepID=UPI003CF65420
MTLDMSTICRTCMNGNSKYYQLLDYVDERYTIMEMLNEIVPQIHIAEENLELSTIICETCVDKLLTSYKFQQMCVHTDNQLKQLMIPTTSEEFVVDVDNEWKPDGDENVQDNSAEIKIEHYTLEENDDLVEHIIGPFDDKEDSGRTKSVDENLQNGNLEGNMASNEEAEKSIEVDDGAIPFRTIKQNSRKKYICLECDKIFDRISRLENHLHIRHKYNIIDISKFININAEEDDELACEDILEIKDENSYSNTGNEPSKAVETNVSMDSSGFSHERTKVERDKSLSQNLEIKSESHTNLEDETEEQILNCFSEYMEEEDDNNVDSKTYLEIDQCPDMDDVDSGEPDKAIIDYIDTDFNEIERPKPRGGGHFPCEECGKVFNTPSRLRRHMPVHSLDKPYACEICKHRFSSLNYLKIHKESHNKERPKDDSQKMPPGGFKCSDCPKRFSKQTALASHRQVHKIKSSTPNIFCQLCQRAFVSTKTLTDHIKIRHPDAEKYSCDVCGKKFILEERLTRHMSSHKDLNCNICGKEFTSEPTLKEHMNIHSGACPYLCSECGKAFKFASSLRKHIERHSEVSKHQCNQCPRSFKCRSDLNKHVKNHLGLKPFKCDICGSKFTRAFNLEQHKRLHTEQSLHKCEVCSVTFSSLHHLRRHVRTH